MIDGITTIFAFLFIFLLIVLCIMHYEGPVNLARRIGLWWLEVAENMETRHMKEHEEIVDRIFKIKGFNK